MNQKSKGRPKGARNVKESQIVDISSCPKCGVTDHDKYRLVNCTAIEGTTSSGRRYTHVVKRRTKCASKKCRFTRTDTFFECHAPDAHPGEENEPEMSTDEK